MDKRKIIRKLEAIIDALESSKEVCAHNPVELRQIDKKLIYYQRHYKKVTGEYYIK